MNKIRRFVSVVVSITLLMGFFAVLPTEVKAQNQSGTLNGTATYDINDGVLTIHEGTILGTATSFQDWPWYSSYESITHVVIDGPVVASGSLCGMFGFLLHAEDITGLSNLDTSAVTSMKQMFTCCLKLSSLDVSSFETGLVTDMSNMFYDCEDLESLDLSNFDTQNVTNMSYMFQICRSLKSLNLEGFNTSSVTDMRFMFGYLESIETLDISCFDTSAVTDMSYMFYNSDKLKGLDLSNFDTSSVTDMSSMFGWCCALESIDISSFDTSNVTNMLGMFYICKSLKSLDLSGFNTSNVINMTCMFQSCESLKELDLSAFDTTNVTKASSMFFRCKNLNYIDLSSFYIVFPSSQFYNMFGECPNLKCVNLGVNFKFNESCFLPISSTSTGKWRLEGGNIDFSVRDIKEHYPMDSEGLLPGKYVWAEGSEMEGLVPIVFKPNGGVGDERVLWVQASTQTSLINNWFWSTGKLFAGWNTEIDGSGVSYSNQDNITINEKTVLYAQWVFENDEVPIAERTPLSSLGGNLVSGSYYLTGDTTLDNDLTISGKVNLYLEGHILKGTGTSSVITIEDGATLILRDENNEIPHYYKVEDDLYKIIEKTEFDLLGDSVEKGIIRGGLITGGIGTSEVLSSSTGYITNYNGGGILSYGELRIYGGSICGNRATIGAGVYSLGILTIHGGSISGNVAEQSGGGLYSVSDDFYMSDGIISYNTSRRMGGGASITNSQTTTFYFTGGSINNNKADLSAGGVWSGREFYMSGGEIANNVTNGQGGGLNATSLDMSGGVIDNNKAQDGGGIATGAASITGGEIKNNTGTNLGGGIYSTYLLELRNCTIDHNNSTRGGGVYHSASSQITVIDTRIVNNRVLEAGGGIYTENNGFVSGNFKIAGSTIVSGNTVKVSPSKEISNNVFLAGPYSEVEHMPPDEDVIKNYDSVIIDIVGKISNSAVIGISTEMSPQIGDSITISENYAYSNSSKNPSTFFVSDNDAYKVVFNDAKTEAVLALSEDVSFKANFMVGDTLIASVPFTWGDKALAEPKIPDKPNYYGSWESYDLENAHSDIVVHGIYTPIEVDEPAELTGDASAQYENGDVTITLNATAPSQTIKVTSEEVRPLDVVLVLDQSGSMEDTLGGSQTKREALISCANSFVDQLYQNALKTGADHRVALVGFAYDSYNNGRYVNTGLIATENGRGKNYKELTASDYSKALLPINIGGTINSNIVSGINSIAAEGATAADMGLKMAKNIFSETPVNNDRERIVIFITDGTPTSWGETPSLIEKTAAEAISVANTIKTAQNAKIYSVGVEVSADPTAAFSSKANGITTDFWGNFVSYDFNRFLHAVSSNYPKAKSIAPEKLGEGDKSHGYYMAVNDTGSLGRIFDNILYNTVYELKSFDKATIHYTLSNDFIMTLEQELNMYQDLRNSIGLDSDSISVTRNDNGSTDFIFKNVPVRQDVVNGVSGYYATVNFRVSALNNVSGIVNTGISSEVCYGSGDSYIAVNTANVTIPSDRNILVFKINGRIYRMIDATRGDDITIPVCELATWTIPAGMVVTESYAEFDATDVESYAMHWLINGNDIVEYYQVGDTIVPPSSEQLDKEGYRFLYWSPSIPMAMPPRDVTCEAIYTPHTHQWVEMYKTGTCDTGVSTHFKCAACDAEKVETVPPHEHSFSVVLSDKGTAGTLVEKVVCTDCGYSKEQNVTFKVQTTGSGRTQVLDLNLYKETEVVERPDSSINMRFYIGTSGKQYKVTRIDPDGSKHVYPAVSEDGYLVVNLDHFSIYTLSELDDNQQEEELTFENCQEVLSGTGQVYLAPTAKELKYTGKAQELVNAGSPLEGKIYYAIGINDTDSPDNSAYSEFIPTGIKSGIYYVWYKTVSGAENLETTPLCLTVEIVSAQSSGGGSAGGSSSGGGFSGGSSSGGGDNVSSTDNSATNKQKDEKGNKDTVTNPSTTKETTVVNDDGSKTTMSSVVNKDGSVTTRKETTFKDGSGVVTEEIKKAKGGTETKTVVTDSEGSVISQTKEKISYNSKNTEIVITNTENADGSSVDTTKKTTKSGNVYITQTEKQSDGTVIESDIKIKAADANGNIVIKQKTTETDLAGNKITTKTTSTTDTKGKTTVNSVVTNGKTKTKEKISISKKGNARILAIDSSLRECLIHDSIELAGIIYPVKTVGKKAMANNPHLTDVTLSNGVSEIKTQAFDGCANLATITLTDSITKIGDKAFRGINSNAVFEIKANKKNYQRIIKLIKDSGIADGITFKRIK